MAFPLCRTLTSDAPELCRSRRLLGRDAIARRAAGSSVDNRHRARPSGETAAHFHRKATHHETGRRQRLEIVQLLDMAIADLAAGAMTFPDQLGIARLGVFLYFVYRGRVPARPI